MTPDQRLAMLVGGHTSISAERTVRASLSQPERARFISILQDTFGDHGWSTGPAHTREWMTIPEDSLDRRIRAAIVERDDTLTLSLEENLKHFAVTVCTAFALLVGVLVVAGTGAGIILPEIHSVALGFVVTALGIIAGWILGRIIFSAIYAQRKRQLERLTERISHMVATPGAQNEAG